MEKLYKESGSSLDAKKDPGNLREILARCSRDSESKAAILGKLKMF
jgi:hypothetical protein